MMVANSEFRLSVVVAALGRHDNAEENMERFVEAFEAIHPEVGAVMAANHRLETLDATFSMEASDAREASEMGGRIFSEVAAEAASPAVNILEIRATSIAPRLDELISEPSLA